MEPSCDDHMDDNIDRSIPEDDNLLADGELHLEDIATSSNRRPREPPLSRIDEASLDDSRNDSYVNQNSGLVGTSMLSAGTIPRAQTSLPREASEELEIQRSST